MDVPGRATSVDIGELLAAWPHDHSEELVARRLTGLNGEARVQVRLSLGLLEMGTQGRPDGATPNGYTSLLAYHQSRLDLPPREPDERERLSHDDCAALQREAMQYYHRRLALLRLGEYAAAAADAEHNLAIMDLLREHAADRQDWLASEQYRVYVLAHWSRARMLDALERQDVEVAVAALDDGIARIEQVLRDDYHQPEWVDSSEDLRGLRLLRHALASNEMASEAAPVTDELQLEAQLAAAIASEEFERAAQLRDVLAELRGESPSA